MIYKFFWDSLAPDDYLFGVDYKMSSDMTLFKNPLMPPSLVIHEWLSMHNYQATRRQVDLPLLKKGSTYRVGYVGKVVPENRLYLQVVFFDRQNEEVKLETIKGSEGTFIYPKEAHHYAIRLLNAGCDSLAFRFMYIEEITETVQKSDVLLSDELSIIIQEKSTDVLPPSVLTELKNYYVIKQEDYGNVLTEEILKLLVILVDRVKKQGDFGKLRLIGYGEYGNILVSYLVSHFKEASAYISSLDFKENHVKRIGSTILEENLKSENIIHYGRKVMKSSNPIIQEVVNADISQLYTLIDLLK